MEKTFDQKTALAIIDRHVKANYKCIQAQIALKDCRDELIAKAAPKTELYEWLVEHADRLKEKGYYSDAGAILYALQIYSKETENLGE